MKYPFTPEVLDAMPEEMAGLYRELEGTLLEEICSRLRISGKLNEVTIQDIRALRSHGIPLREIERAIARATGLSRVKVRALLDDVVRRNQAYYAELIDRAHLTAPAYLVSAREIDAIKRQTEDELINLTRSMGFMIRQGGVSVLLPSGRAYQWALDSAEMQIMSGGISYNEAITRAVKALADSGLRTVPYDSGHIDALDVAVRRAVMTGVGQICARYTEQSAEYLQTDYFEVSAHSGARDTGIGWQNHKAWQGKVYSIRTGDKYPSIYAVCGLDEVDGLEGANCRHIRFTFVEGVSERTYTDEQLANIDPPPFEYEGRTYTAYAATQKQREIERTIRKLKREEIAYKASGAEAQAKAARARIRRLSSKYKAFSKAANLPEQRERMRVYEPQRAASD